MIYNSYFIFNVLVLKQVSSFSSKEGKSKKGQIFEAQQKICFILKLPKNVACFSPIDVRREKIGKRLQTEDYGASSCRKHDKIISLDTSTKCVRISMLNIQIRFTPRMRRGD